MQKKILNRSAINNVQGLNAVEFTLMGDSYTKRILTILLKTFTLHIELYNKRLITSTYKHLKLIGRTDEDILLVYDLNTEEELEINIDDIRIVRVCK